MISGSVHREKTYFCQMAVKKKISNTRSSEKPIILVTNDDGITAPGLRSLVEAMKQLGEVVVVAPDGPQSGMGHAITIGKPLRLDKTEVRGEFFRVSVLRHSC